MEIKRRQGFVKKADVQLFMRSRLQLVFPSSICYNWLTQNAYCFNSN